MKRIISIVLCLFLLLSQVSVFAYVQFYFEDAKVDRLYRLHQGTMRVLAESDATEDFDVICALCEGEKVLAVRVFSSAEFQSGEPMDLFTFSEEIDFQSCSIITYLWDKVGGMIPIDTASNIGGVPLYDVPVFDNVIYQDAVEDNDAFYAAWENICGKKVADTVVDGKAYLDWLPNTRPTSFQFRGELMNVLYTFDFEVLQQDGIHSVIVLRQNHEAGGRYNDYQTEVGGGIALYPVNNEAGGTLLSIGREEYDLGTMRTDILLPVPEELDFSQKVSFQIYDLDQKILYFVNDKPLAAIVFDALADNVYSSGTVYDATGNQILRFDNTSIRRSSRLAICNRVQRLTLDNFAFYGDFSDSYKNTEFTTQIYSEVFKNRTAAEVLTEWTPIFNSQPANPFEEDSLKIDWLPFVQNTAYTFQTPFSNVEYEITARWKHANEHGGFGLRCDDGNGGNMYGAPKEEGFYGFGVLPIGSQDKSKAEVLISTYSSDVKHSFIISVPRPEGFDPTEYHTYRIQDMADSITVYADDKPFLQVLFSESYHGFSRGGVVLDSTGTPQGFFHGEITTTGCLTLAQRLNTMYVRDFKINTLKSADVPVFDDVLYAENFQEMTADSVYAGWDPVQGKKNPNPIENGMLCVSWDPANRNVAVQRKEDYKNVKYEMNFSVRGTGLQSLVALRTHDGCGELYNDISSERSYGLAFMPTVSQMPGYSAIAVSNHDYTYMPNKHLFYIPWSDSMDFTKNTKLSVYDLDDRILICVDDVLFACIYFFNFNGSLYTAGGVTDGMGKPLGVFRNTVWDTTRLGLSARADVMYVADFSISSQRSEHSMLVHDGKTDYRIVYGKDASVAVKHAAEELQKYMMKITGITFGIVTDDTPETDKEILVGQTTRIGKENMPPLKADGFIIQRFGTKLWITGEGDRGVLYGVYGYLEALGCRFFAEDTETIPTLSDIRLSQVNHVKQEPAFFYRDLYWTCTYDSDFAVKSRINGNIDSCDRNLDATHGSGIDYAGSFCHTFYQMVPPATYFNTHPEYYAEHDGVRTARDLYTQLCLTNDDVVNIVINESRKWLDANPHATIISISQNDSFVIDSYCRCAKCNAVYSEEGAQSGTLIRFVNRVAEALEESHPGILVDTLAYQYSVTPPKKTKPRDNVCIRYCTGVCSAHPITECPNAAGVAAALYEWGQICKKMYIWEYTTNFAHYLTPFPNFDTLQKNIQFFKENGADGLFLQGMYQDMSKSGEFGELRSYILTRLAWDPYCDIEKARNEFMRAYYGEGADEVQNFLDVIHAAIKTDNRHFNLITSPQDLFQGIISDAQLYTLDLMWARAKAETSRDSKAQAHVKRSELCWRYYKMNAGRGEFAGGSTAVKNAFYNDCNALGVTRMNEGSNVPWVQ